MKKIKILILVIFLLTLCFCVHGILGVFKESDEAESLKENLIEIIDIPDVQSEKSKFTINFDELRKINSDVVGWIVIEGTQVNYPIVQGNNNSYYLNHSFDRKWSSYGSIFMDYRSSKDLIDYNTFIYGHHTKNGSMFGELYKYMDANFYSEHPFFYLYTLKGNYKVEVFSVYLDNAESESYNQSFKTQNEYADYINLIITKSNYKIDVKINSLSDRIITLYSCSHERNRKKTDRYFIHGKILKIES